MLEQEFKYYIDNQDALVEKYKDKYIVIRGTEVVGAFDDELDAYLDSVKKYPEGTFFIQHCLPGVENYTQTYHGLMAF